MDRHRHVAVTGAGLRNRRWAPSGAHRSSVTGAAIRRLMAMPTDLILIPGLSPERPVFTNRTLNMRSIKAIGYDVDCTLTQYHADAWEERAFAHAREQLAAPDGRLSASSSMRWW